MTVAPDLETTLQRDGLDFHVEHYRAAGEARLVLIAVHGYSAHCGIYRHVGRALAARGIAVTQFDGRGHGRSGGRRGHIEKFSDYCDDLGMVVDWARTQNPGVPWALMGHSLGGAIAATFVLDANTPKKSENPSRLVLLAPWLKLKVNVPAAKRMAANVMAKIAPTFSNWNGLEGKKITRNPAAVAGFDVDPLIFHSATAGWFMATLRAQASLRTHAQDLKVPTLMLLAGGDQIVSNDTNLAFAKGAGDAVTVKTYDGLFHELLIEPEAAMVIEDIADWLVGGRPQNKTA
jgi:alpha-beta hydrolase superfamily lysophospholipase